MDSSAQFPSCGSALTSPARFQALRDLADPQEGVYNATALLAERLSYIVSMLNKYEKLPSRAPTAGALIGSSVPSNTMDEATKTPGNDLLSMLGGVQRHPKVHH